jgi:hypothetical protein
MRDCDDERNDRPPGELEGAPSAGTIHSNCPRGIGFLFQRQRGPLATILYHSKGVIEKRTSNLALKLVFVFYMLIVGFIAFDDSRAEAACTTASCTAKCIVTDCWCSLLGGRFHTHIDTPATAEIECATRNPNGVTPATPTDVDWELFDGCNPECGLDSFTPCNTNEHNMKGRRRRR